MSGLEFRGSTSPPQTMTVAEVRAAVVGVGLPEKWGWSDDLAMLNKAFAGFSLSAAEVERFKALRRAITSDGYLNLTLQLNLHEAVQRLAEQSPPALKFYAAHMDRADEKSPDDFCPCPICGGKGTYSEPSGVTPGVMLTSPCWSCLGTGVGK